MRGRRTERNVALGAGLLALAALLSPLPPARGEEVLAGPIPARVLAVVDGDTLAVAARIWLGQEVSVRVRIAGVDAPETDGACEDERRLAHAARSFLEAKAESTVILREVAYGKYAGRVIARVENGKGEDLASALLAAGHARPYAGGRRSPWCGTRRAGE